MLGMCSAVAQWGIPPAEYIQWCNSPAHSLCSVKRTKVIDDESDHFSVDSNRWLSDKDRERLRRTEETLREKKHESRRNKPVNIDFAGRQIVENTENIGMCLLAATVCLCVHI